MFFFVVSLLINHSFQSNPTASHIRLVESSPGNYEVISNGSLKVNGKSPTNTSVGGKAKPTNIITVSSASPSALVYSSAQGTSGSVSIVSKGKTFDLPTIASVMSLAE